MANSESDQQSAGLPRFSLRAFLVRDWPYLAMLILALAGVAYTSVARQGMTTYWIALAPCFALLCIFTRWRSIEGKERRWRLVQTEVLHWLAVIIAMSLVFVTDVENMMNADATALMVLTLLALGTFTAGIHVGSWRICMVGAILALAVPAIAWLEEATLLLFLGAIVLVSIAVLFRRGRRNRKAA
ncbi:MAG: hypothetical protein L0Y50_02630 [Beijerinckiaceae bacterium]|nr:hypothetical protein [Beijerinckiaceae bacterium]MCI0735162.1 hypothetical protein [Beijerinckiaceae bacterium]